MQLRSGATYASMSAKKTSSNQDAATIRLEEISATQQSHQDAIIQLNSKLDEIMKLLEKSQEKRPIEEEIASHQFRQSPSRSRKEQDNFMMGNQRRNGQPPIDTWDEMKLKMKEHFLPTDYEQLMYTKLFSLNKVPMWESDAQLAAHYKAGLRMEIQLEMIVAHTYTVDDVYQLALKIEEGLKFGFQAQVHKLGALSPTGQQANL
ncbi:hypothetical protein AAG906_003289 [Vitis piasezkii]